MYLWKIYCKAATVHRISPASAFLQEVGMKCASCRREPLASSQITLDMRTEGYAERRSTIPWRIPLCVRMTIQAVPGKFRPMHQTLRDIVPSLQRILDGSRDHTHTRWLRDHLQVDAFGETKHNGTQGRWPINRCASLRYDASAFSGQDPSPHKKTMSLTETTRAFVSSVLLCRRWTLFTRATYRLRVTSTRF